MRHVAHMNESCRTHEWVMSHTWMSHVARMKESCRTHEWVMSHIWTSHVAHMNESCRTYEWVMSHTWMSHVARLSPKPKPKLLETDASRGGVVCVCEWVMLPHGRRRSDLKWLRLPKFHTSFHQAPVTFKQVFTGFPRFQSIFHGSKQESLSLKRVDRKTVQSGDPNIQSLISSVSGKP